MQSKHLIHMLVGTLLGGAMAGTIVYFIVADHYENKMITISYTTNFIEAENTLKCLELIAQEKDRQCINLLENRLSSLLAIISQLKAFAKRNSLQSYRQLFGRARQYKEFSQNPDLFEFTSKAASERNKYGHPRL